MNVLLLDNFIDKLFSEYFIQYHCQDLKVMDASHGEFPASLDEYSHIILSGSEDSIIEDREWVEREMALVRDATTRRIPTLGICYGHQLIARALFGKEAVRRRAQPGLGWKSISQLTQSPLFAGIDHEFNAFISHFDEVTEGAPVAVLAQSEHCEIQAMAIKDAPLYGVQFHPEINMLSGKRFLSDLVDLFPEVADALPVALQEAQDTSVMAARLFENFYGILG